MRYTDYETGRQVCALADGEGNIYSMLRYWGVEDDWDRFVRFDVRTLPIREFDRLTKDWKYAGCRGDEIAAFVRAEIADVKETEQTTRA